MSRERDRKGRFTGAWRSRYDHQPAPHRPLSQRRHPIKPSASSKPEADGAHVGNG